MTETRDFGDLQLAILRILWERGEAPVSDIVRALRPVRDPAASTVATVLSRLEDQGVVGHRREGRRYVYRARIDRAEVRGSMLEGLVQRAFEGDPLELVGHLVRQQEIDGADLDRLRALLEARGE